jgi:hypothetical protein
MFERVVIAIHPVKHPAVLFQQPDQLAAVSFHQPKSGRRFSTIQSISMLSSKAENNDCNRHGRMN